MLVVAFAGSAQPRPRATPRVWRSDVSVRALDLSTERHGGAIAVRVIVAADSDDARAVRLEIMLPVGVGVLRVPDGCQRSPGPITSLAARVSCALGGLPMRGMRDVTITTTGAPPSRGRIHFAAFTFSDTPDPVPSNNFAERVVP
jgi:hypothetical protein